MMTAWARLYRPLARRLPAPALSSAANRSSTCEQDARGVTARLCRRQRATRRPPGRAPTARAPPCARACCRRSTRLCRLCRLARASRRGRGHAPTARLLFESNAFCIPGGELAVSYPVPARDGDSAAGQARLQHRLVPADRRGRARRSQHRAPAPPRADPAAADPARCHRRRQGRCGARRLAPSIADIFIRAEQPIFQPIYDLASPRLVFGRVALLGRRRIRGAAACRRRRHQGGARCHVPRGRARRQRDDRCGARGVRSGAAARRQLGSRAFTRIRRVRQRRGVAQRNVGGRASSTQRAGLPRIRRAARRGARMVKDAFISSESSHPR